MQLEWGVKFNTPAQENQTLQYPYKNLIRSVPTDWGKWVRSGGYRNAKKCRESSFFASSLFQRGEVKVSLWQRESERDFVTVFYEDFGRVLTHRSFR